MSSTGRTQNALGGAHPETIASDEDHICVYRKKHLVCIHSDKGRITLTPEQALDWAQAILDVADKAADEAIDNTPDAGFDE